MAISVCARAAVLGSIVLACACSLALNPTAVQCTSEAECVNRGPEFANTTCNPTTKTCEPLAETKGTCKTNADCLASTGQPAICRKSDQKCAVLPTAECPDVFDPKFLTNDAAIVIGYFGGMNQTQLGVQFERIAKMAQVDFTSTVQGGLTSVDGTGKPRPVVILACNEANVGVDGLINAGNHLAKDLQVPIIIGPYNAGLSLKILTQVALPTGTMMIAPNVPFDAYAKFGPNPAAPLPLLWRMVGSDGLTAKGMSALVSEQLEARLVATGIKKADEKTRVLLVIEASTPGQIFGSVITSALTFNGTPATQQDSTTFQIVNMGNPVQDVLNDPAPLSFTAANVLPAVFSLKPHIILFATSSTYGVPFVVTPIENGWDANTGGAPRPIYVASQVIWTTQLGGMVKTDPTIVKRMFFESTKVNAIPDATLTSWLARYNDANKDQLLTKDTIVAQHIDTYDAVYLSEYALMAIGNKPLTGVNAANAVANLSNGQGDPITDAPEDIAKGLGILSNGRPLTLNGMASPVVFDTTLGSRKGVNVATYCLTVSSAGAPAATPSGYYFDVASNTSQGAWDATKCP